MSKIGRNVNFELVNELQKIPGVKFAYAVANAGFTQRSNGICDTFDEAWDKVLDADHDRIVGVIRASIPNTPDSVKVAEWRSRVEIKKGIPFME